MRRLLDQAGTQQLSPTIAAFFEDVPTFSTAELSEQVEQLDRARSAMLWFMKAYDAIICPVSASPAVFHGQSALTDFSYTYIYNLVGWPAAVVRGGTSPEGLPIGVQIVARPWREDVALALASRLEIATGGWQAPDL